MSVTELWEILPNGRKRLINTIKAGSKFESSKGLGREVMENLHEAKNQLRVAIDQKEGWINRGNSPLSRYEILCDGKVVG